MLGLAAGTGHAASSRPRRKRLRSQARSMGARERRCSANQASDLDWGDSTPRAFGWGRRAAQVRYRRWWFEVAEVRVSCPGGTAFCWPDTGES